MFSRSMNSKHMKKIIFLFISSLAISFTVDANDIGQENKKKIDTLQKELNQLKQNLKKQEHLNLEEKSNEGIYKNVTFSGDIKIFAFSEHNPVFRAGKTSDWMENIGHLKASTLLEGGHKATIRLAAISTVGDDIDSYGPRSGEDEKIIADELNIHLKDIFDQSLDVKVGRQSFKLGTGFLVSDGYFDSITRFNGTLSHFDGISSLYKINDHFQFESYWFRVDNNFVQFSEAVFPYTGGGHILGGELTCKNKKWGKWSVGTLKRHDQSDLKNETIVTYLRGNKDLVKDLNINFEIVHQSGKTRMNGGLPDPVETNSYRRNSWGGFVSIKKQFSEITYKPWLQTQYVHYGGDKQSTSKNEGFDPLFFSWIPWGHGAINNTNTIIQKYTVGLSPTPQLSIAADWWNYHWDHRRPGYSNKHYATLTAVNMNYSLSENVFTGAFLGYLDPHEAGTKYFGPMNDRTIRIVGAWVVTTF